MIYSSVSMNFENAFIGPQSIQVCHLRSKTPLTSVDRLRGPPCRSNVDRIFANHPSQAEPSSILPHPFISSAPAPPGRCSPATRLPPRALAMGAPAPSSRRPWGRPSSLPPPASAPRRRGLSPPPSPRRPGPPPPPSPRRPVARRRTAAGRIRARRGVAPPPAARTELGPSLWPPAMAGHGAAMATAAPPPSLSLPPPSRSSSRGAEQGAAAAPAPWRAGPGTRGGRASSLLTQSSEPRRPSPPRAGPRAGTGGAEEVRKTAVSRRRRRASLCSSPP